MTKNSSRRANAVGATRPHPSLAIRGRPLLVVAVTVAVVAAGLVGLSSLALAPGSPPRASPAIFSSGANVSLDAYGVSGGGTLQVTGSGFPGGSAAKVSFVDPKDEAFPLANGEPSPYNLPVRTHVHANGRFSATLDVPNINAGTYRVLATDGSTRAFANYYVGRGASGTTKFTLSSHSVASDACITVSGSGFYLGDIENVYIGNPGQLYRNGTFDDTFTGTFSGQSICASYLSAGMYVGDAPGTYALLVVGDTYGIGAATLTITAALA